MGEIEMTISLLFSTIDEAKNLGSYALANLAWACLLEQSLDMEEKILKWEWEIEGEQPNPEKYNSTLNYYDLAVITDGLRFGTVPAPILTDNYAKKFMRLAKPVERRKHSRIIEVNKFLVAEQELKQLLGKLYFAYPNCFSLNQKYFGIAFVEDFHKTKEKLRQEKLSRNYGMAISM